MEKKMGTGAKIGIGAGVAAAALAAAGGAYFVASKNAKGHRAKAKKLFEQARKEVVVQAKKLKKIERAEYERVVGSVMKGYAALKSERPEELMHVANELKSSWHAIEREVKKSSPKVKRALAKAVKKAKKTVTVATKKSVKKSAKKKRA